MRTIAQIRELLTEFEGYDRESFWQDFDLERSYGSGGPWLVKIRQFAKSRDAKIAYEAAEARAFLKELDKRNRVEEKC